MRLTSEMREAILLDQLQLLAIDHDADVEVHSQDRVSLTPVVGPQVSFGRMKASLVTAVGSDGVDRTAALQQRDGVFADPGTEISQHIGVRKPLSLDLDFGPLPPGEDLLLCLTGWLRFGSSSNNIATSQRADVQPIWPRLEAQTKDGQWHTVSENIGLPTGHPKSIVCDLEGRLPADVVRLRLTTTFEVRWDEIALLRKASSEASQVTLLPLKNADLQWHGFADVRIRQQGHPETPDPRQITDTPPWSNGVQGWCTRYGAVDSLLTVADQKLAIFNAGDGMTLHFDASNQPDLPPGKTRTLAIYSRGWIKEGDANSFPDADVAPFPGSDDPENQAWQIEFNTRWVPRSPSFAAPAGL